MRQNEEQLYRGISDADRLAESYHLPRQLSQRVTSHVINSQVASTTLNVAEEDRFLRSLSE
jgi:hypothetical protein